MMGKDQDAKELVKICHEISKIEGEILDIHQAIGDLNCQLVEKSDRLRRLIKGRYEREFRECPVCGVKIEISLTARRKSSVYCSGACRAKAYRMRIKMAQELASEGRSLQEIAAATDSDPEIVRGWIANWRT